ncbi:arylsulfatase [Gordonia sp. NPDC003424]
MVHADYRTSLPIQQPRPAQPAAMDVRHTETPASLQPLRPPAGAPNVVMILLDDMGFGASSAFGGPCRMPVAERLAAEGLRYTRFHTTAMCSPTRAALLTGRNHHTAGMGVITELATAFPGYSSSRPDSVATLPEMLRRNGYSTGCFGKYHQTPTWEMSRSGPFDRWPTGEGFEKFYGFMGGETDQYAPTLFEGTTPVATPQREGYHLSEDIAERAIADIRQQQALSPDKPFFSYLSFGAVHAPHHAPAEYVESYRGDFDHGWDAQRERTLSRQKELGILPEETDLSARPDEIGAWDEQPENARRLYARMMEAYAAMATHTDEQIGKVVDALDELGQLDNTMIIYILGDNGASGEGGPHGCLNEFATYNLEPATVEQMLERIDEIGGPSLFNHYPVGWAHAMNTPYQWTKQIASHWGGTRNGMIVHWPAGIEAAGENRHQFTHVNDVAATILEAAGLPEPTTVNGVAQKPFEGVSMVYSFDDADAPEQHTTQYFELFSNRGIYHDGWSACTIHGIPWVFDGETPSFADDDWELYAPGDISQAHNLASAEPERLQQLKDLFLIEGAKYNVFPLDDRKVVRLHAPTVGRPQLMAGRTTLTLFPGMSHMNENVVPDTKNCSWRVGVEVGVGASDAGALVTQGSRFGGWALYLRDGVPAFHYSWIDVEHYEIVADERLAPGDHTVEYDFSYDGGGVGKGGIGRLFVDGICVGETVLEHTVPFLYHTTDGLDVGADNGSPVTEHYGTPGGVFTGTIHRVVLETDTDKGDEPGAAEARLRAALATQ